MERLQRLYRTSLFQVALVGCIGFANPGLYNTITGIGGAGSVNPTVTANGNVALYSCGMVSSLFIAPVVYKYIGHYSMFIGGLTYPLYMGSLWAYKHIESAAFVIAAGAILGIGAQLFWICQGSIMTSYPLEAEKGTAIAVFWVIFNLGSFLGGIISFGINFNTTETSVTDSTYIAFLILMIVGTCISLIVIPREKMIRSDGSHVALAKEKNISLKQLMVDVLDGLKLAARTPKMLALIPMFYSSNFFYSYQFDNVNAALFNVRTRGLNNALYWAAQMLGSLLLSLLLDNKRIGRRKRTLIAVVSVFILFNIVWIGGLISQLQYGIYNAKLPADQLMDITSGPHYGGELVLYIFFGLMDSAWQTLIYYLIGSLSNDPAKLSLYTGIFKLVQNGGAVSGWRIDATHVPYLNFLIACWVLVFISFPGMFWVAWTTEDVTGYTEEIQEAKDHDHIETEKVGMKQEESA
ncbi:MFS general substrate transporter [Hesseltinella vesiculosa]|uniref:MFS general substrate transporter n=1 Tax=Hesseltinella vesiculosa TaxID=101127 RepID=A0A1X2GIW0_9FUNG|nr:MFS general substrate transporter [Hesseltinella vesiculosa]